MSISFSADAGNLHAPYALSRIHREMLMDGSAIIEAVIQERGYRSIAGAEGMAELRRLNFPPRHARLGTGLLLPLHTTDGKQPLTLFRPDAPDANTDGRTHKYLFPKGQGMRLDCPPRCRVLLADPGTPLWVTEGQKKADALASAGATAVALLGVWNFKGRNAFGGVTLSADFDYIAWKDGAGNSREVRLVYDSDARTNPDVHKALQRLTEHLTRKGAAVRQVFLPVVAGQKVGVDDYLAAGHTIADLEALVELPRPQPQPAPATMELLESAPALMRRPLALIQGRTYAAIWAYVRVTRSETLDNHGEVIRLAQPEVTNEQRLLVLREDGVLFGDGGQKPLSELGIEVLLPDAPQPEKLWSTPSVKAYIAGARSDPSTVFNDIVSVVDTFIDFDRSLATQQTMCELVACYILATWFLDAFTVIGYLWPNGEKGSGKTQLLTVIAELAYLGQVILAGGSYACLRDLADYGATLCFDDAENVMDLKRGDPDKRALLLAGNRKGNTIPVKEPLNGHGWRTRLVQTFCPRLFSAIRLPDDVLASRTIIVPLVRTANRAKANADVLEYRLWPVPKTQLVDACWALALHHGATLQAYDATVAETAPLLGRTLEPWRAIMAIAHWLTDCGVTDLASRIETLAKNYQKERPDLEPPDLTALTLRALCHYAINSISAVNIVRYDTDEIIFFTDDITELAKQLIDEDELSFDAAHITVRRIGRACGRMRFQQKPRIGGKGKRQWICTKGDLQKWLIAYGMPLPEKIFSDDAEPHSANGSNGFHGSNGTDHPGDAHPDIPPLCTMCGGTDRWQHGDVWRCVVCWPRERFAP